MRAHPDRGLHDPASEHDSCGFGLIARIEGDAERRIVDIALKPCRAWRTAVASMPTG